MIDLDLQFFAEETENNDSLGFEDLVSEFESEYEEVEESDEVVEDLEIDSEVEDDEVEEEEETVEPPSDEDKRNTAFAELRRQADANKRYADFVGQLAERAGMNPEEVIERFKEQELEKEAESQNVPVEVLKKLQELEQENEAVKEQVFAQRFNAEVASTVEKYEATEADITKVFEYVAENGIDLKNGTIPFETAYRLAHLDTIVAKEVDKAKQISLDNKRKRQLDSAVVTGSGDSIGAEDMTDEYIDKELKKMGLSI